jgi:hypothetical protein
MLVWLGLGATRPRSTWLELSGPIRSEGAPEPAPLQTLLLPAWTLGHHVPVDKGQALIAIDSRGRASLGRLHPTAGRYLGEVQSDGTVVLRPATVMTALQARLFAR